MKRSVIILVGFTLLAQLPAVGQSSDEESLRIEFSRVWEALANGDADYFRDHYVSDVSRIHLEGEVDLGWSSEKADGLASFFETEWRIETEQYEIADLRIYDDIAIIAGTASGTQIFTDGEKEDLSWRFSYVWIKTEGRWLELHHHVSYL